MPREGSDGQLTSAATPEDAIDLVTAVVIVAEEARQQRDHASAGPQQDGAHVVVVGCKGGDEDAVVVEGTVGNEDVNVDVQLQRGAEGYPSMDARIVAPKEP